jgi:catechol 2,3-dioxygenase-like lactoylglutathione lyase family enzyme
MILFLRCRRQCSWRGCLWVDIRYRYSLSTVGRQEIEMSAKPALSFSHLGIHVTDLGRMEHFYSRVLGFTVTDRGKLGAADLVFLSRVPGEHHQIVMASGRPVDLQFNVVNQISFRLPSLRELRRLHAAVSASPDVTDIQPITHGNAWSVYCRDPEGNRVELFVDTPWYTPQPFRIPIDFAKSDAEIRRWTEAECRSRPGFAPRGRWLAAMERRMGIKKKRPRKTTLRKVRR